MRKWLSPNIGKAGRLMRAGLAIVLFLSAWFASSAAPMLSLVLYVAGVFTLLEAWRGWCILRACGIKTRL